MSNIVINNLSVGSISTGISLPKNQNRTENPLLQKYTNSDNYQTNPALRKGDISHEGLLELTEIPANKNKSKDPDYKAVINKSQTVLSVANNLAKLAEKNEISNILVSSDGALTVSKAIVSLKDYKESGNKAKTVMSSISQVASGVGTVLSAADIPEAEFIKFTGKIVGLGAEQQNLSEQIEKKDVRGIAGTTVSFAKGGWGAVLSGAKVTQMSANIGFKMGRVSSETVGKISLSASKISSAANKVAIPFAIAGTGLSLWDWIKADKKIDQTKEEYHQVKEKHIEELSNTKVLRRDRTKEIDNAYQNAIEEQKTDSIYNGISFGLSAISSAALVASVAFPPSAAITAPVALGGSIASSLVKSLASSDTRKAVSDTYHNIKEKYNNIRYKFDSFILNLA